MKARIIRAENRVTTRIPNPERARVLSSGEQRAARRAEVLLQHAQQQAEQLLEDARQQATAHAEAARAQCETERTQRLLTLQQQVAERQEALLRSQRESLTALAVGIAEKLLGRQLELRPETVVDLAAQTLRSAAPVRRVVLHLHPDDLPLAQSALPQLRDCAEADTVQISADASLQRGDCRIQTPLGEVDGTLQTQLAVVAKALAGPRNG